MQWEFKEAGGLRVLADLYMTYASHGPSMAEAWAAFVADSHTRAHQMFDAKLTSPERVTTSLMHCITDSLHTGFSTREDVQYFFKRCFGRILKDLEALAAAAWSDPLGHKYAHGTAYLQVKEQNWLLQFTYLICEPVKPSVFATLKAVWHMHHLNLHCLPKLPGSSISSINLNVCLLRFS